MKNVKLVLLTMALTFGFKSLKAQDQQQLKIGYVNVEYVLSVWPAVKAVQSELKTYEEQLAKKIQEKQQELQQKYEEYQRSEGALSEATKQAKQIELQSLQSQIQLYQKDAQIELVKKQQEKLTPLFDTVSEKIKEVSEEQNYTHVFNQTIDANSVLLYAKDETNNMSIDVLKKLGVEVPEDTFTSESEE